MRYNNYHKHDMYGNVCSLDVLTKPREYCERAIELGHTTLFTTNHGMQGNLFECYGLAKEYGLKMIVGAECYYVNNRHEKDRSNRHVVIVCLTNEGVKELNGIISQANIDGFYYKPRIDHELLFSLTPKNFIITTACIAGLWNDEKLIQELHDYFGNHFFLEVQNHDTEGQKNVNRTVIELSKKYSIKIIHANDSHYIREDDSKYRDLFLNAKGLKYNDEENFILDYPDSETIIQRYEKQGVLNKNLIKEALENTLIFDNAEDFNLINDDIKLPQLSATPNEDLKKLLNQQWKVKRNAIPKEQWKEYLAAIQYEMNIVEKTNMANYFLIDYQIAKIAKEKYGGVLTKTGRGSAPSFYITNLLDLTNIDRLQSPITLFPTRFMSIERILGARSMPDIDLNAADTQPFIQASKDLLGDKNCEWMISWKPLQRSSAFRLYCKAIGLDIQEYDEIAKNIDKYEDNEKWKDIIKESEHFVGVVEGISESPCSICLYDKDLSKEIGLIKTPNNKICCLLDGYNCDKYKYLKNDYLTVSVWAIIKDVCTQIGIDIPTTKELLGLLDEKTWDIYAKGLTCSINQADSDYATPLVQKYRPKTLAEMSAFVAIIRPGCASLLNDFLERKKYTTHVKELDDLLEDSTHRMIYQESIMKYLIWLGISEPESYDIIKKIAKKKFKEQELKELREKLEAGWLQRTGSQEYFEETWQVVQDAAHYSFNASHSLSYAYDSLYGAYLKSHYPLEYYQVVLNHYSGDIDRTNKLVGELKYFNIDIKPPRFRHSKYVYEIDKKSNTIYKGIASIKFMNSNAADYLDSLKNEEFEDFISLLQRIVGDKQINSRQIEILIKLNFFEEFGSNQTLLEIYHDFVFLYERKNLSIAQAKEHGFDLSVIESLCRKKTDKQYTNIQWLEIARYHALNKPQSILPIREQILFEQEYVGYISATYDVDKRLCLVSEVDTKYSPKVQLYSLKTGKVVEVKIEKELFKKNKIKKGDIIVANNFSQRPKWVMGENGWSQSEQKEWWLNSYDIKEVN